VRKPSAALSGAAATTIRSIRWSSVVTSLREVVPHSVNQDAICRDARAHRTGLGLVIVVISNGQRSFYSETLRAGLTSNDRARGLKWHPRRSSADPQPGAPPRAGTLLYRPRCLCVGHGDFPSAGPLSPRTACRSANLVGLILCPGVAALLTCMAPESRPGESPKPWQRWAWSCRAAGLGKAPAARAAPGRLLAGIPGHGFLIATGAAAGSWRLEWRHRPQWTGRCWPAVGFAEELLVRGWLWGSLNSNSSRTALLASGRLIFA